ncbi:MAG: nucleotidyl transferase AbiEii/AbiGii toxin family protein [Rhodothermales bacterium]|nr:nucleotidyl transferase AbiEii/AbiGii toxin family protein [Rhodothermales bacterium]
MRLYICMMEDWWPKTDKEAWAMKVRGFEMVEAMRVHELRHMELGEWKNALRLVHTVREPDVWLFQAALSVQRSIWEAGYEFAFIGGVALQRWGEVRFTTDVDVTLWCPLGEESNVTSDLESAFGRREPGASFMARIARTFAGRTHTGHNLDVALASTPYARGLLNRAVDVDFGVEEPLHVCSAEDLTITKTCAGRGQDWVDLKRIIQRSGRAMDWDLVWEELAPLLAMIEDPERMDRLRELVAQEKDPPPGNPYGL